VGAQTELPPPLLLLLLLLQRRRRRAVAPRWLEHVCSSLAGVRPGRWRKAGRWRRFSGALFFLCVLCECVCECVCVESVHARTKVPTCLANQKKPTPTLGVPCRRPPPMPRQRRRGDAIHPRPQGRIGGAASAAASQGGRRTHIRFRPPLSRNGDAFQDLVLLTSSKKGRHRTAKHLF
jgi:hypothetical protein